MAVVHAFHGITDPNIAVRGGTRHTRMRTHPCRRGKLIIGTVEIDDVVPGRLGAENDGSLVGYCVRVSEFEQRHRVRAEFVFPVRLDLGDDGMIKQRTVLVQRSIEAAGILAARRHHHAVLVFIHGTETCELRIHRKLRNFHLHRCLAGRHGDNALPFFGDIAVIHRQDEAVLSRLRYLNPRNGGFRLPIRRTGSHGHRPGSVARPVEGQGGITEFDVMGLRRPTVVARPCESCSNNYKDDAQTFKHNLLRHLIRLYRHRNYRHHTIKLSALFSRITNIAIDFT